MPIEALVQQQNSVLAANLMAASVKAMQASTAGIVNLLEQSAVPVSGPSLAYSHALDVRA